MIAKNTSRWVAKLARVSILFGLMFGISACGYSEEQWQAQLDKYNRLVAQNQSTDAKLKETEKQLQVAKNRVAQLEAKLQAMGVDISKLSQDLESRQTEISQLSATLEEREKALAEYKARARQLEAIKKRFELLRSKLQKLTNLGLKVEIRNNRMIISLPGDVLFASGRAKLTKEGEEVLGKVSSVIGADASLRARYYQVAGHTDNKPFRGGVFGDNWGLSLMRARSVLLYMIDPETGKMPVNRWSASGYGETDPVASNDTDVGRQKNRRCEIVVVPSAEEMLDIQKIAK
jgi:chemotaxis protein MotB